MSSDDEQASEGHAFRSGFVAIIGRPNVGKSTLMNAILGQKVSIVTPRAQTTRNRIIGVHTEPHRGQIVFVDTPGIHQAKRKLNRAMVQAATDTAGETDVVLFVVEAQSLAAKRERAFWGGDAAILDGLKADGVRPILVINKVDLLKRRHDLLPILQRVGEEGEFDDVVPVSAERKVSLDRLIDVILENLPEGPQLYPDEIITNRPERFLAAEFVREQVMLQMAQEIPYSAAVTIDSFVEVPGNDRVDVKAVIHVERPSQKSMVIGKNGERIKRIGTAARKELELMLGCPVYLETFVRVQAGWVDDGRQLTEFGYDGDEL